MKKSLLSILAMALLMVVSAVGYAQSTYTKITSAAELEAGAKYILVGYDNDGQAYVMSYQKSNNRHAIAIAEENGVIVTNVALNSSSQTEAFEFTLGGSAGEWTIFDPLNNGYLYAAGGGNYLKTQGTLDDKGKWTITMGENGGFVPVSNGGVEQCYMRYNITSTLFGCYKVDSNVSALVYFFKEGGEPIINPEPDLYPENFAAEVDGNSAILTWAPAPVASSVVDARAYLIVGSTGDITVPVDGVPVANDLDAFDGQVAYNVMNDGNATFTFNQLMGNSTYHFAIFPYNNSNENIDYKTDGNYPTADAVIGDSYCLLQSNFAAGLDPFETVDLEGEQHWQAGVYDGIYYAKMNGFASGSAHANEDWLITPNLLAFGTVESARLSFMNAAMYDGNALLVKVSTDYCGDGDPQDYTWTDITSMFEWSTGDYAWVTTAAELPVGKTERLYVAFVYICGDNAATAWEVADVTVMATGFDEVNEHVAASMSVYPNPAHETVSFQLANDAQVSVFDMTGRLVGVMNMTAGEARYAVAGFESGVYFLNIRYADGKTEVGRFVKY
jgi:hypothetical protein